MPASAATQCRGGPVNAGSTATYTATLVDYDDVTIPGSALVSLTLTIVDTLTGIVINGVLGVSILNVDRGTVDELGNITVALQPGDTSMGFPTPSQVSRTLIFNYAYNSGQSQGYHVANFQVNAVPASQAYLPFVLDQSTLDQTDVLV